MFLLSPDTKDNEGQFNYSLKNTSGICDVLRVKFPKVWQEKEFSLSRVQRYAQLFNIDIVGKTREQLIEEIKPKAPCDWIDRVYQLAKINQNYRIAVNFYASIQMDRVLMDQRLGNPISQDKLELILTTNEAILNGPRTTRQFRVYRGIAGAYLSFQQGEIFNIETPKSGSFDYEMSFGYTSGDCCLIDIFIPREAAVSYHPGLDEVIFPTGAKFYILTQKLPVAYKITSMPFTIPTYQAIYISAPSKAEIFVEGFTRQLPDTGAGVSPYSKISPRDAYIILWFNDAPFPYGDNPNQRLEQLVGQDPNFLREFRQGKINNAAEARLYLALKGYDTRPYQAYDLPQMLQLIDQANRALAART